MRPNAMLQTLAFAGLMCAVASPRVLAAHNEPLNAKQLAGEFLTAYEQCGGDPACTGLHEPYLCCTGPGAGCFLPPNATTSNGHSACAPAVRSDSDCGFTTGGKGKFLVRYNPSGVDRITGTSDDGDLAVQATVTKLDAGCVGKDLTMTMTVRATVDDCGGEPCSIIDLPNFAIASCVVDGAGSCRINTTVNKSLPGTCINGKTTGVEVVDVSMFDGSARTLRGGVKVP